MYDDFDLDEHHPACKCGCGQLADECGRLSRRAVQTLEPAPKASDFYDYTPTCRWRNCTLPGEYKGYCDVHWGTL